MWRVWYNATDACGAPACHQQAGLWGARGISAGMMKGKVTSKHTFPKSVHTRVRKRYNDMTDVYGLFAYLKHAGKALSQVCVCDVGVGRLLMM